MQLIEDLKTLHKKYSMQFTAALVVFEVLNQNVALFPVEWQEPIRYCLLAGIVIGRVIKQV